MLSLSSRSATILVTYQGEILLLKRYDNDTHYSGWCLPGGKVEAGESFVEGASRELKEETGLDFSPDCLEYLANGVSVSKRSGRTYYIETYHAPLEAFLDEGDDPNRYLYDFPSEEHEGCIWIDPESALRFDLAGEHTENIVKIAGTIV